VPPGTEPKTGNKLSVSVVSHAYVGGRWQITASVGRDLIRLESANQISGAVIDIFITDHIVTVFPEAQRFENI